MMEKDSMRPNLVIRGIGEMQDEDCKQVVNDFIKEKLRITDGINLKKAFRIGKGKNRAILVTLTNPGDKATIYNNVKHLKGQLNYLQCPYQIDDQMPLSINERKRKLRNIVWRNKNTVTVTYRLEMNIKKGKLYIKNKEYVSKIVKPNPARLISLKAEEIAEIDKIEVKKGQVVTCESSSFVGYVADTKDFNQVNMVHEYVKFHNMNSRHITCACLLGSERAVMEEEYEDDDEHGGGHQLLEYMKSAKLYNRTICVTRNYDGMHIGIQHYDMIVAAAKHAVNQKPYNWLTGEFQFSWTEMKRKKLMQRGSRGGRGGMWMRHIDDVSTQSELSAGSDDEATVASGLDSNIITSEEEEVTLRKNGWWNETTPGPIQDWSLPLQQQNKDATC